MASSGGEGAPSPLPGVGAGMGSSVDAGERGRVWGALVNAGRGWGARGGGTVLWGVTLRLGRGGRSGELSFGANLAGVEATERPWRVSMEPSSAQPPPPPLRT